jgi:glycosyltransferase involved in cell wall biosynthesis
MSATPLSIVIPTHDRAPILARCLAALDAQRGMPEGTEIVVVDDGSRDDTRGVVASLAATARVPIVYLAQPASGPAAARNLGVRHARGRVLLFLGDDILAEPTLVAEHVRLHAAHPGRDVAVLGFVTWSDEVPVTPYMRWLESSGNQFDYGSIGVQDEIDPARFFYTSNLSLKREVLVETGELFDERFRHALLEDIDLGRRLAARGLRLKYNPAAVGRHHHAVRLAQYARRIELSSEYWVLLERKASGERSNREPDDRDALPDPGRAVTRPRRDYAAYTWFLLRVAGEIARNWPYWWVARLAERRRDAPVAFERAHRYWAHRGLLRLEVKRAMALATSRDARRGPAVPGSTSG